LSGMLEVILEVSHSLVWRKE